jgi:hypothetical protein
MALTVTGRGANPSVPSVLVMTPSTRAALAGGLVALSIAGCSAKGGSPKAAPAPSPSRSAGSAASPPAVAAPSQRPAPVEKNPPGDIPDNIAYVPYHNAAGRYSFVHPEGWAAVERGATVTFTDKLNGVTATAVPASAPPTVSSVTKLDLPELRSTQPAFEFRRVTPVRLPGGSGVLIVFRRNSVPDPVTGRAFRDEVNRYEIYGNGHEVILDLYGAIGSDNVDPYTKMSQSLRLA